MKKRIFIGIFLVFSLVIISCNLHEKNLKIDDNNILGIYLDNELQTSIPKKGEAVFSKAVCDNDEVNYYWDIDNWGLYINNFSNKMKCNLYFVNYSGQTTFDFDYTGIEQTFIAPVSGTYRLETWGAQGGSAYEYSGGYGGYSDGIINLSVNNTVYINVGGSGTSNGTGAVGGYNGGGASNKNNANLNISRQGSGGGATHISNKSGLLNILENSKFSILIVSGGGGGANYWPGWGEFKPQYGYGGSAGGFVGNTGTTVCPGFEDCHSPGTGGSQVAGGMSYGENIQSGFGIGGTGNSTNVGGAGGGGGFYGGGGSLDNAGGGGGSGYIGNPLLKDKVMYCYNCEESNEESTKTISTTCSEETPTENCAKKGNGYARITLVSIDS